MTSGSNSPSSLPRSDFERRLESSCPQARHAEDLLTLALNVGLRCNLSCELCQHSSGPERTEEMPRGVMLSSLQFASDLHPQLLDVTGGEPVLWPHLRELVSLGRPLTERLRVRTNLDALLLPEAQGLPAFLAENDVEVLGALPEALECRTIGGCVEALQLLSAAGYGDPAIGARAPLDIAYNPMPGELVGDAEPLRREFARALGEHGVHFRSLTAINNVPLGGFAAWLEESGERERYRAKLRDNLDAGKLAELPCRHGIEIAWDGTLWDCDYNLAARLPLAEGSVTVSDHVGSPVGQLALEIRRIAFSEHCFACAVGDGSLHAE